MLDHAGETRGAGSTAREPPSASHALIFEGSLVDSADGVCHRRARRAATNAPAGEDIGW